ncbi:MAG: DUF3592 domain-containing protein [Clostridia bacterium]|nr:DUF3592 domain-containing protein [Clostridia bacterium]
MKSKNFPLPIIFLFIICSIVFSFWGIRETVAQFKFLHVAKEAKGTIVDIKAEKQRKKSKFITVYRPVVEFITDKKIKTHFESKLRSSINTYKVNEQVPVLYEPLQPSKAEIKSFWNLWFGPITLMILGIFSGLAGVLSLIHRMVKGV